MKIVPHPADTTLEAARVQSAVLRKLRIEGRARLTFELCEQMRQVAEAGIRQRHPEYTADRVRWAVLRLAIGENLFAAFFPQIDVRP